MKLKKTVEATVYRLWIASVLLTILALFLDMERAIRSLHMTFLLLLSFSLGGAVVLSIQSLTASKWLKPSRPLCTRMARFIPLAGGLLILALFVSTGFYPESLVSDHPTFRDTWLQRPFILLRSLIYIALWSFLSSRLTRRTTDGRSSDQSKASAIFLVALGSTYWLACVDWLMALRLGWVSTLFWVYCFAGVLLGAFALLAVLLMARKKETASESGEETSLKHDLGKILFGLATFWAYIWFSQFMLIWYTNIPAEAGYFSDRVRTDWEAFFYINLVFNWVIPFILLLPRITKTFRPPLLYAASAVLVGRWIDTFLMVLPDGFDLSPWYGGVALLVSVPWLLLSGALIGFRWEDSVKLERS